MRKRGRNGMVQVKGWGRKRRSTGDGEQGWINDAGEGKAKVDHSKSGKWGMGVRETVCGCVDRRTSGDRGSRDRRKRT